MNQRLKGKTAIITAAGQGIGRAIAEAFAEQGAVVVATDINGSALATLEPLTGISTTRLDALDTEAINALAAAVGPQSILVNCAGFVHNGSILDCTDSEWDFAFNLNVKSMFRTCKAFIPGMLELGHGSIINIASIAGIQGLPNRFAYASSKAAVLGLTKSIARDFVAKGIRCNAISPGTVQTPSLDQRIAAFDDPVAARKSFIARQPMGRLGTPEEIAAMALYLAADESVFTTGQNFCVDGGMSI